MIEVKENPYDDRCPEWVNKCPCCDKRFKDTRVDIRVGAGLSIHFVLCRVCREELADKLLNPMETR